MLESYRNSPLYTVARADALERATFIRRTYTHLAGALLLFAALEYVLLQLPIAPEIISFMTRGSYGWLMVLGLFMVVSWVANAWAVSAKSLGLQYAGLALYVVAEAVVFLPLLYIAQAIAGPQVIGAAGVATLALFAGLTATVFITRKDFSFMGPILAVGGLVAMGVIVCSILFGFNLGTLFAGLMALFAGGAILYSTSNVLHQYRTDQYVAAALSLFAAVALLFWYILRIFLSRNN
jgi:FtsH-binding integral membrane protein